jgi:hypothetical protein
LRRSKQAVGELGGSTTELESTREWPATSEVKERSWKPYTCMQQLDGERIARTGENTARSSSCSSNVHSPNAWLKSQPWRVEGAQCLSKLSCRLRADARGGCQSRTTVHLQIAAHCREPAWLEANRQGPRSSRLPPVGRGCKLQHRNGRRRRRQPLRVRQLHTARHPTRCGCACSQ